MAAPNLKANLKLKLEIQKGAHVGQNFSFEQDVIKIGRGSENDVVLSNDARASRYHAEIRFQDDNFHLVNVSQKNFIAVNGSTVDSAKLSAGDIVVVGESEMRVDFAGALIKLGSSDFAPGPAVAQQVTKVHALQAPGEANKKMPPPLPSSLTSTRVPPPPTATPQVRVTPPLPQQSIPHVAAAPSPVAHQHQQRRAPAGAKNTSLLGNPRVRFFGIVAIIGVFVYWLMSGSPTGKRKELGFRSSAQVEKDVESSKEEIKSLEERKEKMNTVQFRRAQENFIRGFREYKQGNFARAREAFQVVLNLDPDNPLASRYYNLSKVKFDEMVKFHMLQGNRYREKKNWHLCRSSYFNVMTMLNNPQDSVFKEAKQFYDECSLEQEGNF